MKVYTKTGDQGTTALYGGTRVPKHSLRIDSYGTVDELNSWMGLLRDQPVDGLTKSFIQIIQNQLFTVGAILATPPEKETLKNGKERLNIAKITEEQIKNLENEIDRMDATLAPMTHFILPGGHQSVSFCHIARTVCRRAERITSELQEMTTVDGRVLKYLNRLSDYLFVLARKMSADMNADEVQWIPEKH
ncbi:MAG: cob(I)yrinic acid a,c-diamide adenosyltransferase [Nonlabens sp.]